MLMRFLITLAVSALLLACGPGDSPSPSGALPPVILPIANEVQQKPNWCWVATSRQVIASVPGGPGQSTPPQCVLAADALGVSPADCCSGSSFCDVPASMQSQQYLIRKYAGRPSAVYPPTTAESLYQTIRAGYGVILTIRGTGLVGHVVVLRGMVWENGVPYVIVNDPSSYFPSTIPFQELVPYWQAAIVVS